jgi:hypothetical protein
MARQGLQKARRVGMIAFSQMIFPALPDIGAAFGRPSVFLGGFNPFRVFAELLTAHSR